MRATPFGNRYLLTLLPGEEIIASLREFCRREQIRAAAFTGLGGVARVTLASGGPAGATVSRRFALAPLNGSIMPHGHGLAIRCRIALDGNDREPAQTGWLTAAVVSGSCELVFEPLARGPAATLAAAA
ncbi:MAG TPA: DNA-binding protein [bacterium]|nr:DNA-binding protein [bacterium]